jgi:hypothetical protein
MRTRTGSSWAFVMWRVTCKRVHANSSCHIRFGSLDDVQHTHAINHARRHKHSRGEGLLRLGRKVGHTDVGNKGLKDFTNRSSGGSSSSGSINDRIGAKVLWEDGRQGSLRRGKDDDDVDVHATV